MKKIFEFSVIILLIIGLFIIFKYGSFDRKYDYIEIMSFDNNDCFHNKVRLFDNGDYEYYNTILDSKNDILKYINPIKGKHNIDINEVIKSGYFTKSDSEGYKIFTNNNRQIDMKNYSNKIIDEFLNTNNIKLNECVKKGNEI